MKPSPRFGAVALLLAASLGCRALSGGTANVPTYDAETFFASTTIRGASFSADGSQLLMTSDESGVFNAHAIDLASGETSQLTRSTSDAIFTQGWFPDDNRFLYSADQGGNELTHLYVLEEDGTVVDLTPGEELKARFFGWSEDDSSFFVLTNERDPQFFDLYRYYVAGDFPVEAAVRGNEIVPYPREQIFRNPGGYNISDVSRDGLWVALAKIRNNADDDIYVVRVGAEEEQIHVTPHTGDVSHGVMAFSPDHRRLYYSSNAGSEFDRVWSYDLTTGERSVVFEDDWDVRFYSFSRDGRYLVTGVNADARTEIRVFDAATGAELDLPNFPGGDIRGVTFEPDSERVAFYVNGDTSPSNLVLLNLATDRYEELTDTLSPDIDADDLVEAEVVRYPSFDGLDIPALLYRPHQASAANPLPALVWVHGGPGGQSRKGYSPTIQHLVNNGYAILAVNNRGSSGYGKTFHHMDDRRHGDVDLKDCIWGRRYLEGLDWVDGDRVGIIGGSYGGYMVCAALAFEPEAFEVGVDIFGVTNWLRTLESIPAWWADFRDSLYAEMGDPEKDRESLHARSPLFHAENIVKPMLVVQGANDPRVLQVESDEMVAKARANGVEVEYVLFPDEGHGFRAKKNRITASRAYVEFLDRHLKGAGSR